MKTLMFLDFAEYRYLTSVFERPNFERMIADIEAGLVNLVVVKDLSRFGREYAQMGLYIEHYFEEHEVRFIAIGEGIDTINGTDNILMPITKGFYQKDRVHTDEEEWIVVNGTHEALVTQDTWALVHKMMESRRRECRNGEIQMFAGLVKCGGCGTALSASYDAKKDKFRNFSCWVYKNYGKERCSSHAIGWKTLPDIVQTDIRRNAQIAADHAEEYLQRLTATQTDKQKKETEKSKRALKAAEKRIAELDRIIAKLYADSALGKVPEARAESLMAAYEQEHTELSAKRDALQIEINQAEQIYDNAENFVKLIAKHLHDEELNAAMLNELIEKIVVHEKEIDENGQKIQQVDIHYRFIGFMPRFHTEDGYRCVRATVIRSR